MFKLLVNSCAGEVSLEGRSETEPVKVYESPSLNSEFVLFS